MLVETARYQRMTEHCLGMHVMHVTTIDTSANNPFSVGVIVTVAHACTDRQEVSQVSQQVRHEQVFHGLSHVLTLDRKGRNVETGNGAKMGR